MNYLDTFHQIIVFTLNLFFIFVKLYLYSFLLLSLLLLISGFVLVFLVHQVWLIKSEKMLPFILFQVTKMNFYGFGFSCL